MAKTKRKQTAGPALPVILSSRNAEWGRPVNRAGYKILAKGGDVIDAVIASANVVELDPNDDSVGYGGIPNEAGTVQLDACVMHGPTHNCGAVACLEGIKMPSKIARLVMERSDHILMVGSGAQRFAVAHGYQVENLLTEKARLTWLKWKENLSQDDDWLPPKDGIYRDSKGRVHGTINVLGIDSTGNLGGVTTTSGLWFKIPGRVGDSPIIGAGLYVDNEIGAAGATGRGEEVIRTCGSFYTVQMMGQGMTPAQACLAACKKIVAINKRNGVEIGFSDKFIAVNKKGEVGCAAILGSKKKPPLAACRDKNGFREIVGQYLIERK
ncbi:MAG: N(4)-(beta-N-acetylglucosaminyl)-L-asparaginase [Deltaproteobacteria bacterium]|nr:N(4)-(beta-N-acetylglucosaminyl)-L-asparaginase [Deltaproteobacteria bacterium]